MKIIAVGMNYAAHNKELHHSLELSEPTIFMKSDSSLLKDGKPFFIPDFSSEVHYETEIVVRIDRLGKNIAERFAHRYYNEVTVGIDFTARDLQNKLRAPSATNRPGAEIACGGNCARCAGSCGAANHETVTADRAEREAKLAAEKAAAKQAAVKAVRDAQPAASDSDRKGDNA